MLYADGRFAMNMGPFEFKEEEPISEGEWEMFMDPAHHLSIREGYNLYP
ncbi:hypothetical protein [Embleya sp. NPDC005575]